MRRRTFNPLFWALLQVGSRVSPRIPASLDIATGVPRAPAVVVVPTRHGSVRVLLFRPDSASGGDRHVRVPVVMHLHGGGFINREPEQDRHVARHLAAGLGAMVVVPDYDTAPEVRYPVAEEQMFDVARWIRAQGSALGANGGPLFLSGISAGAKLAINVCQQLHSAGEPRPAAVALTVPVTDMTRTDRTSSIPKPAISPFVQRAVAWGYVPDVERRREVLAPPRFDASLAEAMPPTLVQTAEFDTLAPEGADLASAMAAGGVEVLHHEYLATDHDFYSKEPVEVVREMLDERIVFLRRHL